MKKLLGFFKDKSDQPSEADQEPKWYKPLSKKFKHSSAIPGSFFEREQRFKAHTHLKTEVVPPRSEGFCDMKTGRFSSWTRSLCSFDGTSTLTIYAAPPFQADGRPSSATTLDADELGTPLLQIQLVGSHLAAEKSKEEFSITYGHSDAIVYFRTPSPEERNEWFVALGKVPGIYRRVRDFYTIGKQWGHGATSEVYECIGKFTGKKFAYKTRLNNTRDATVAMHNELRILQLCAKHPHQAIPSLEDYFFDTTGRIELIMQLMEGGELFDWIASKQRLDEYEAKIVFAQVAGGVAHLHSLGIAHRDLKPQNLMYVSPSEGAAEGIIKIMDYDLSRVNYSPEWEGSTPCGTIHYMAPEMVRCEKYSLAADCWSMGVILYILLCGNLPFDGHDDVAVQEAIDRGHYILDGPLWENVTDAAKDLVKGLLQLDPTLRYTAQQCLDHHWLIHDTSSTLTSDAVPIPTTTSYRDSMATGIAQQNMTGTGGSARDGGSLLSHELRTVENLRKLGSSFTKTHSSGSSGGSGGGLGSFTGRNSASLSKFAERVSSLVIGSPPKSPPVHKSPLSKALDYDLEPLRRHADEHGKQCVRQAQYESDGSMHDGKQLSNLRVQLELVGTKAGIQDRRLKEAQPESPMEEKFADLEMTEVEEDPI